MSQSSTPPALEKFVRLSPAVWFYQPTTSTSTSISKSTAGSTARKEPDLILICGWMSATPRHLSKYTIAYAKLYPTSSILFITTSVPDSLFRSASSNFLRISPVVEMLCSLPADATLLVQTFSNGGAWTMCNIARQYREEMGRRLTVERFILDSAPGKADIYASIRAFAVSLPSNPLLYYLGLASLYLLFGLYTIVYAAQRNDDFVEQVRKDLNDTELWEDWGRRLYIFSVGDQMVQHRAVEEHAMDADRLGFVVRKEKYGMSGHVAHMLQDSGRYWGAVQRFWDAKS